MTFELSNCPWCGMVHPPKPPGSRIGSWTAIRCSLKMCRDVGPLILKTAVQQCFDLVHHVWLDFTCRVPVFIVNDPDDHESITTVYCRKTRREIRRIAGITHDPKTGARFYVRAGLKTFIDPHGGCARN